MIGQTILDAAVGPLRIESELGRGGMGIVLLARPLDGDGRAYALKVLIQSRPENRARFERERSLLLEIGSAPGFVPFAGAGTIGNRPYVLMPFLPGGTLADRLKKGPLPVDETIAILRRLATTLAAAHARGVVHRDLKPANVLFDADGEPRVTDLGLAKHFAPDVTAGLSATGEFRGTIGYACLEQFQSARSVGPAADVYALGAIGYECLTGRLPIGGATVLDHVAALAEGQIEPLERPDVPAWLEEVLRRALAKEPENRYADAAALRRALEPRGRTSRRLVAGGGVVLLLGAGAFVIVRSSSTPPAPPVPGPLPAPAAPIDEAEAIAARAVELLARGAAAELERAMSLRLDARTSSERARGAAHSWRAEARSLLGRADDALDDATRACALAPSPRTWLRRGVLELELDRKGPALTSLDRAVALAPNDGVILAWRGKARIENGDAEAARADLERACQLAPLVAFCWDTLGSTRALLGDEEGTDAALERAIALEPRNPDYRLTRCVRRERQGDRPGALEDAEAVIAATPERAGGYRERSVIREKQGDLDGAIADARRAATIEPARIGSHVMVARALRLRFQRDAKPEDREAMIEALRAAAACPEDELGTRANVVRELGSLGVPGY